MMKNVNLISLYFDDDDDDDDDKHAIELIITK